MDRTPEADEALSHGLRLEARRPQMDDGTLPEGEREPLDWELPAEVELCLTQTDIVDGIPVISQVQLEGDANFSCASGRTRLRPNALDVESTYPYRYASVPLTVTVTLPNGETETLALESDAEGTVCLQLPAVPVRIAVQMPEAANA